MSFKAGIIGCGGIAHSHASAYKAQGCEIVAVTDVSGEAAAKFAAESGGQVYPDAAALIQQGKPDVVSICTPPVAHADAAVLALEQGVPVLCEKPMAYDIAAAHRMRDAVKRTGTLFMPAFRHRFLPANIALRDLIKSGKIGDVVLFNNIFCGPAFEMEHRWFTKKSIAGGGCILDTNSHSVDLFRFLVGEITAQSAVMHRHFKTTDVEDAGILTVKAENGAVGCMESAFVAGAGQAFIDVIGTRGRARYDYMEGSKLLWRATEDNDWTVQDVQESWGFGEEISHFLGAIRGERALACTVEDGVRATEVIMSVYA